MPIRLLAALVTSCLVAVAAECAAPPVAEVQESCRTFSGSFHSAGRVIDPPACKPVSATPEFAASTDSEESGNALTKEESIKLLQDLIFSSEINGDRLYLRDSAGAVTNVDPRSWCLDDIRLWTIPVADQADGEGRIPGTPDHPILARPKVPSLRLDSLRLNLHLDTRGVGPWETAVVELWITRDGWFWHRFHHSIRCDSLRVSLPESGRYGLRVVVHELGRPVSPTPCSGEVPQLWVEVGDTLGAVRTEMLRFVGQDRYYSLGFDHPAETTWEKEGDLPHPSGSIKRVETEKVFVPFPEPSRMRFTF